MIFVINNLKYDTDKMELISDKCEYWYKGELPMKHFTCLSAGVTRKICIVL